MNILLRIALLCCLLQSARAQELMQVIEEVKPSVVGVGSLQQTRGPAVSFIGTGFVIGDGLTVVTAAHVVNDLVNKGQTATLGVLVRAGESTHFRAATLIGMDKDHDLARLRISKGSALPALRLGDSSKVREGKALAFMGFPLGMVLGLNHVTHRCIVSAITPLATPAVTARQLDGKTARQLQKPAYSVFQLDGTAYPGSSGSPLFDPATGEVVGVVNMVFVKGVKESAITAPSGITYAIPANYLKSPPSTDGQ
ncbi:trypsin-like serine protease [Pseudoduganella sp. FT25W]|uniref:Trypsin-like serine protease n=1 Tax=Duganella alba TaxID=2666081 RepID=A0A6L5Q9X6_9BURK|nr:serine protease [Duganella alba]MRX06459.1 trypsin-like serine protease [Duganella alba]MRX14853.1 trypsin-like serine protease [Duganella alba]